MNRGIIVEGITSLIGSMWGHGLSSNIVNAGLFNITGVCLDFSLLLFSGYFVIVRNLICISVSYTHLDVYKRQSWCTALWIVIGVNVAISAAPFSRLYGDPITFFICRLAIRKYTLPYTLSPRNPHTAFTVTISINTLSALINLFHPVIVITFD